MKKIEISKNFYQYQFPPFERQNFGFNIYVLIDENEALLIDTAFEEHAIQVVEDLKVENIEVKHVVFSHFHPDHISGLPALNKPKLYGNALYQETLNKYTPIEKHHYFVGMNSLIDDSTLKFGAFNLHFKWIQGHVPCGMFTIIDEKYIHVADDVMESNDGRPILPSVHVNNAQAHIESLELLKTYSSYTLLLSHGNAIVGKSKILEGIKQRQTYLKAIVCNSELITIEQALVNCDYDFLHKDWHNYVYQ